MGWSSESTGDQECKVRAVTRHLKNVVISVAHGLMRHESEASWRRARDSDVMLVKSRSCAGVEHP